MRVPVSWLRDYVAVDMPLRELADRLSVTTAEVDGIERVGVADTNGNLELFRVGRVLSAEKHSNADRLQLCRSTSGRASRVRSSAARGTSAPVRPSRSRCRAPCFRTGRSSSGGRCAARFRTG